VIGKHASWYLTKAAKVWNSAVVCAAFDACSEHMQVIGKAHEVNYTVYQGSGSRGDVDNYAKTILDSLVKAGVLKSDASVIDMKASKRRDRENPRTEIHVRAVTGGK
jgi:Holliday junction resolvase RusA-like endonuclease